MENSSLTVRLRLRPHHICCLPFIGLNSAQLDQTFYQALARTKELLTADAGAYVTAIDGVDDICRVCPSCVNDQCQSPPIQEDKVRRLDSFLLKELGGAYGDTLPVAEWRALISDRWPYRLCRFCRWRRHCGAHVV